MVMSYEENPNDFIKVELEEAENISELHKKLSKNHQLMLEVSDLVKTNLLKLLTLELTLTIPFLTKSTHLFSSKSTSSAEAHIQYFRYTIKNQVEYYLHNEIPFYIFQCN